MAALCTASVVIALSLDLGVFPSESHRSLSYALNLPGYAWERARGLGYGPLAIDLAFPPGATGAFEPIVATGTPASSDLLYVNYVSPTQLRFGFVSTDGRGPLSDPVTVSFGESHHLELSMGSLYPPDGHPSWISLTPAQEAYLTRRLIVELDGRRVFDAQAHFDSASPERVYVGETPHLRGYSSPSFSGKILAVKRLPFGRPPEGDAAAAYGEVRLVLRFPEHPQLNAREPLVTTGVPRAGDILYAQYLEGGRVCFGIDHWGGAGFRTEPIPVDPGVEHEVSISIGSLFPGTPRGEQPQHARVALDGRTVFAGEQDTYDSSPYDVSVGSNPIGGSTCAPAFTGRIVSVQRGPGPAGR